MANSIIVSFTFVLVLLQPATTLAVHVQALAPFQKQQYFVLRFRIDVDEYDNMLKGIADLATRLSTLEYMSVRLLPYQTGDNFLPPGWVLVDLVSSKGETTLAIRCDNLYLLGFTNSAAQWYAFANCGSLIDGSIELDKISGSYKSVGGRENLNKLLLGRDSMSRAVEKLLDYDHASSAVSESELKEALATIILMVCEATRFINLSDFITSGWATGCFAPTEITAMLTSWSDACDQILEGWPSNKYTRKVQSRFPDHLQTAADILRILRVLMVPLQHKFGVKLDPIAPRNNPPPSPPVQPLPPSRTP